MSTIEFTEINSFLTSVAGSNLPNGFSLQTVSFDGAYQIVLTRVSENEVAYFIQYKIYKIQVVIDERTFNHVDATDQMRHKANELAQLLAL